MPDEHNIDERPPELSKDPQADLSEKPDIDEGIAKKMDEERRQEHAQVGLDPVEYNQMTEKLVDESERENDTDQEAYHFFIVHESSGKIEVANTIQPGVVSYAFDPDRVTPRDLRYMLEAAIEGIDIEPAGDTNLGDYVKLVIDPQADAKRADIWLDIKHRPNIRIGVMELWRYNA